MAFTTIADPLILKKWETDYFLEFVRQSGFNQYMGPGANNPIVVRKQLIQGGQIITMPLLSALAADGKGTGTLVNNEESMVKGGYDLKPYWHRYAVAMKKSTEHDSVIDLANAVRDLLKTREMDDMRDSIINALTSMAESPAAYDEVDGHPKQVPFAEATTTQKNAWAAANQNRIVPGNVLSNYNATFATMTNNIDTTADTCTADTIRLAKRVAKQRDRTTGRQSVRPIRTGEQGREFFVCFLHPYAFRDLQNDLETINVDGRPRNIEDNPVFQDGDLLVDGVICREIPEMPNYSTIGASSAVIVPGFLCGAQALGFAWGQMPRLTTRKEDDYGFINGVGTESLWAVEKLLYTPPGAASAQDYGVVSILNATVAD